MPVAPQAAGQEHKLASSSSSSEDEDLCKVQEPKSLSSKEADQKTEEFNILNNLVNKILSNLEVRVSCVTVRVLTKEMGPDVKDDIPTVLLRLTDIIYKRKKPSSPVPQSDMQAILDGKALSVQEASVHYMKSTHLYTDEYTGKKHHHAAIVSKLHYPQEYPLTSHPSTLLLAKGFTGPALDVAFTFIESTQLLVQAQLANVEAIVNYSQAKGLLDLTQQPMACKLRPQGNEMLDYFGELVKNNQKFSGGPPVAMKQQQQPKPKSFLAKKMNLHKEKLIFKFLKSQQQKSEYQQLRDELKKSMAGVQTSQESQASGTLSIDQSMLLSQVSQSSTSIHNKPGGPLTIKVDGHLASVSAHLILNENLNDKAFETNISADERVRGSLEPRFSASHYSFSILETNALVEVSPAIQKEKASQISSLKQPGEQNDKLVNVKITLGSLSGFRFDLTEGPNPRIQEFQKSESMSSQFESVASSTMFRSAQEFYILNDSRSSSGVQKRTHVQPVASTSSLDQSQISPEVRQILQYPPLLNPIFIHPYLQHFVKNDIIEIKPLQGLQGVLEVQTQSLVAAKKETRTKARIKVGSVSLHAGVTEFIVLQKLGLEGNEKPKQGEKSKGLELLQVQVEAVSLGLEVAQSSQTLMQALGQVLEQKPIDTILSELFPLKSHPTVVQIQVEDITITQKQSDTEIAQVKVSSASLTLGQRLVGLESLKCIVSLRAKNQTQEKLQEKKEQKPFVYYEGSTGQQEEQRSYLTSQSVIQKSKHEKETLSVGLSINHLWAALDFSEASLKLLMGDLETLDSALKTMLIIMDVNQCHNREEREKRAVLAGNKKQLKASDSPNVECIIKIQDTQALIHENAKSVCKVRLHASVVTVKYFPPANNKERIMVLLKVSDLFAFDYLQQKPVNVYDSSSNIAKPNPPLFSGQAHMDLLNFEEELLGTEDHVIVYKLQHQKAPVLDMKIEVLFKLVNEPFQERVSVFMLHQLYILHCSKTGGGRKQLQSLNEELLDLKKNPMICRISIISHGLVVRALSHQAEAPLLKFFDARSSLLLPSTLEKQQKKLSQDRVEVLLTLHELFIDMQPILTKKQYDKVYLSDFVSVKIGDQKQASRTGAFSTDLRALIQCQELNASLLTYSKDSQLQSSITLKSRDLSLRVLQEISHSNQGPGLLLDVSQSIASSGGLLDQMGFSQILYLDLCELKKTDTIEVINNAYVKESLQEESKEEEEDLFATTYNYCPPPKKIEESASPKEAREVSIVLVTNKAALYLTKDNLNALSQLGKIALLQTETLEEVFGSSEKEELVEESVEEDDQVSKILDQYLLADLDPNMNYHGDLISSKRNGKEEEKEMIQVSEEDGYFEINTALHIASKRDIIRLEKTLELPLVNLKEKVIDDYLPVLSFGDVEVNRHRQCHSIPRALAHLKPQIMIHFEVHSFELKLFEGFDFDFTSNNDSLTDMAKAMMLQRVSKSPQISQSSIHQSFILCQDDYLEQPKSQVSNFQVYKRQRRQGRGNFMSLQISNLIATANTLENLSRYCLSLQSLILKETISRKQSTELISVAPYQRNFDNQIELVVQKEREDTLALTLSLQPFKLSVNQAVLNFLINFFDVVIKSKEEEANLLESSMVEQPREKRKVKKKKQTPLFVSSLVINPTYVMLSYTSSKLSLGDLSNGKLTELLNIINLRDLRINVVSYQLKQTLPIDEALKHIAEFYVDDLVQNQKVNLAKAIGPIRVLVNVGGAFFGLISHPYEAYMSQKGLLHGLSQGTVQFFQTLAQETGLKPYNII